MRARLQGVPIGMIRRGVGIWALRGDLCVFGVFLYGVKPQSPPPGVILTKPSETR